MQAQEDANGREPVKAKREITFDNFSSHTIITAVWGGGIVVVICFGLMLMNEQN